MKKILTYKFQNILIILNVLVVLVFQSCVKNNANLNGKKTNSNNTNNSNIIMTVASIQDVTKLNQSDYLSWLVKSVCVNASGALVAVDPYGGCPVGNSIRKIQVGDPIPYNNFDQLSNQISDSFSLVDFNGAPVPMHTFDYVPFNQFNQHSGSDGYDIYYIGNNNVSISTTKDGGGYGSTFFGANCTIGDGWRLFPSTNFLSSSQYFAPIAGVYWEQSGLGFPGICPPGYSTNTLTSWSLQNAYAFGGINSNIVKSMDTIISFHGFETDDGTTPTSNFLVHGHLEVFYYTREYGLTRWEVWTPTKQMMTGTNKSECNGPATSVYKGQTFNIQFCHDWSNVKPLTVAQIPQFPIPSANLLKNYHFDSGFSDTDMSIGIWHRFGKSPAGNLINRSILTSKSGTDAQNGSGLHYLAINCGAATNGQCSPPGTQALYQDIPISSFCSGCNYIYGINARTESGVGTFQLAVQMIDDQGVVLWQDVQSGTVLPDNGDGRQGEAGSIYKSVTFIHKSFLLPSFPSTRFVRFLILPNTPNTFDFTDVWVNRFPTLNVPLVTQ